MQRAVSVLLVPTLETDPQVDNGFVRVVLDGLRVIARLISAIGGKRPKNWRKALLSIWDGQAALVLRFGMAGARINPSSARIRASLNNVDSCEK